MIFFYYICITPHNINALNKSDDLNIILQALKQGDTIVYKHLYSTYYEKLCVFLTGYTNDIVIVEDVVQDVFLKIWTDRKNLTIKKSLSGYLYKSAYNSLMNNH